MALARILISVAHVQNECNVMCCENKNTCKISNFSLQTHLSGSISEKLQSPSPLLRLVFFEILVTTCCSTIRSAVFSCQLLSKSVFGCGTNLLKQAAPTFCLVQPYRCQVAYACMQGGLAAGCVTVIPVVPT